MSIDSLNSFNSRKSLDVSGSVYEYYSLGEYARTRSEVSRLPLTLKVLLENLLRNEDGDSVTTADINAVVDWLEKRTSNHEIAFLPLSTWRRCVTPYPGPAGTRRRSTRKSLSTWSSTTR